MLAFWVPLIMYPIAVSQLIYEPTETHNTILGTGIVNTLLNRCEGNLKEEYQESLKCSQTLKITKTALLAMQKRYNLTDSDVVEICKLYPTLIFPHPHECQLYYNCSMVEDEQLGRIFCTTRFHLTECIYPDLFSEETLQCENFTEVTCGGRREQKYLCGYTRSRSSCGPHRGPYCSDYNSPTQCVGHPDGFQEDLRKGDPYYVICVGERAIKKEKCPIDNTWNLQTFIYNNQCVPMFEIPSDKHQYGKLPSCSGTSDGSYKYPDGRCDAYYTCNNGTAHGIKCPENQLFDSSSGTCKEGTICI